MPTEPGTGPSETLPPLSDPPPLKRKPGELLVGDMVGQYQVTGKIGEGGMGTVYGGIQPVIGKKVAIKLLQAAAVSNPEVVTRFVQEARAVNQIRSRYIVDIFSFSELSDGQPYFVMEFLEGESLRGFIRSRGTLAFSEAYQVLRCITKGLAAAHEVGIFHRDLKPENIVVLEEDEALSAKILDFGIAKLTGSGSHPGFATATGMALGTPYYMSPEQARGVGVDHRTDVYSLGVIMFEMFTGALPFEAKSYVDLVNMHLFSPPPRPRDVSPDVPEVLEALIVRCLAKDPAERPQSMGEVFEALTEMSGHLSGTRFSMTGVSPVQRPSVSPFPGAAVASRTPPPPTEEISQKRGSRVLMIVGLVAVVALGGAAAGYAIYAARDRAPERAASGLSTEAPLTEAVKLTIKTQPPGATVEIDGELQAGATPVTTAILPGAHQVRLRREGREAVNRQIVLEPGQNQVVEYVMPKAAGADAGVRTEALAKTGRLVVRSKHGGATFLLDGRPVGRGARLELDEVAAGAHLLTVKARGRRTERFRIVVEAGRLVEREVTLRRTDRPTKSQSTKKKPPTKARGNDDPDKTLDPFKK